MFKITCSNKLLSTLPEISEQILLVFLQQTVTGRERIFNVIDNSQTCLRLSIAMEDAEVPLMNSNLCGGPWHS